MDVWQELYDAARIDGAGRFRQTLSITLPSILPTVTICPIFPTFILLFPIISSDVLQELSFIAILSPRANSFSSFNLTYPLFEL